GLPIRPTSGKQSGFRWWRHGDEVMADVANAGARTKPTAQQAHAETKASRPPSPARPPDELEGLIRARYPIIYVVRWEEERVEQRLNAIAKHRNKQFFIWTYTQGITKFGAEPRRTKSATGSTSDPLAALDAVLAQIEPAIFLFKDFHPFTEENRANLAVIRRLRDVAYHLRDSYKTIVIIAPVARIAP